jgi:hypothetical protein
MQIILSQALLVVLAAHVEAHKMTVFDVRLPMQIILSQALLVVWEAHMCMEAHLFGGVPRARAHAGAHAHGRTLPLWSWVRPHAPPRLRGIRPMKSFMTVDAATAADRQVNEYIQDFVPGEFGAAELAPAQSTRGRRTDRREHSSGSPMTFCNVTLSPQNHSFTTIHHTGATVWRAT